jgi:hypothetical protein
VEDWTLIRRLHLAEGESMRPAAERLGISRNTVAKAVKAEGPPKYQRAVQDTSAIRAVEPRNRYLLKDNPRMPATVIAERIPATVAGRGSAGPFLARSGPRSEGRFRGSGPPPARSVAWFRLMVWWLTGEGPAVVGGAFPC